jgi:hypothetical protein
MAWTSDLIFDADLDTPEPERHFVVDGLTLFMDGSVIAGGANTSAMK